MSAYPLFERASRLADTVPVARLVEGATPVGLLSDGVWLKRDDLSAADYGGNKIRKLDFLLAGAKAAGVRTLIGFGYAGSNFVAAMAWHGRKLGLDTHAFLLPQKPAPYVADNLSVALHAGAHLHLGSGTPALILKAAATSAAELLRHGRAPQWIPPGGSSPLGVLGFINAALELQGQIRRGELPEPEQIYVAFSSMGTVAGLALGLELAGLRSRIQAVQVVDQRFATRVKLGALIAQTVNWLQRCDSSLSFDGHAALARVDIRQEFFGPAYATPTAATLAAIKRFSAATGARADSAYSGKALAGLYCDLDAGLLRNRPVLFWHTFNAHGLPPEVMHADLQRVPEPLRMYFAAAPG